MPKPKTAFDQELLQRAKQPDEEADKQAQFRDRVFVRELTLARFCGNHPPGATLDREALGEASALGQNGKVKI